ncbi:hypothetical protein FQZ97_1259060 [compost metagenome]
MATSTTPTAAVDHNMKSRKTFCAAAFEPASSEPTAEPEAMASATNSTGMAGVFQTGRDWCTERSKPV